MENDVIRINEAAGEVPETNGAGGTIALHDTPSEEAAGQVPGPNADDATPAEAAPTPPAGEKKNDAATAPAQVTASDGARSSDSAEGTVEAAADGLSDPEEEGASRVYSAWVREAEEAKAIYPSLDLGRELSDPRFPALLLGGVDVATAYAAIHLDEILPAAMRHAVREAGRRMSERISENARRASENGAAPAGAQIPLGGVKNLTRTEREDIIRRVGRGERISF